MRRKYPALLALVAQVVAAALQLSLGYLLANKFQFRPAPFGIALAQGVVAAAVGHLLGLSRWWLLINLIFAPALLLLSASSIPSWMFLVGFVLLLLLFWNSFGGGVPLYLTGEGTHRQLEQLLKQQVPSFRFIDLGSGLAGTLWHLSKRFPHARFEGVETAPLVFLVSWFRCLLRNNCRIRYRSLWTVDLSPYDVVYCFLSPVPMPELWKKATAEMKGKALLVSNTFEIPGVSPGRIIELKDWRESRLLIWEL